MTQDENRTAENDENVNNNSSNDNRNYMSK